MHGCVSLIYHLVFISVTTHMWHRDVCMYACMYVCRATCGQGRHKSHSLAQVIRLLSVKAVGGRRQPDMDPIRKQETGSRRENPPSLNRACLSLFLRLSLCVPSLPTLTHRSVRSAPTAPSQWQFKEISNLSLSPCGLKSVSQAEEAIKWVFTFQSCQKKTTQQFQQDPCFNETNKPEGKKTTEAVEIPHCLLFPQLNQISQDRMPLKKEAEHSIHFLISRPLRLVYYTMKQPCLLLYFPR